MTLPDYICFQAIAWHAEDVNDTYMIKVFGVDEEGQSVCLSIPDFKPYFYIRVPDYWSKVHAAQFQVQLEAVAPEASVTQVKLMRRKDFWGFTNNTLFNFARIDFDNHESFKRVRSVLEHGRRKLQVCGRDYGPFQAYEANIDPFVRLIHIKDIKPSGWIRVPTNKTSSVTVLPSTSSVDIECSWKHVESHESDTAAAFTIASFDIECMSSHGDFPVPIKDYRKPAQELVELYRKNADKLEADLVDLVRRGMYSMFSITGGNGACSRVFPKQPVKDVAKIKNAINLAADDVMNILTSEDVHDEVISKLIKKMAAIGLPKLAGDEIIAIGMTVHKYGSKDLCGRYILTLGACDPVTGVDVRAFDCERKLLLAFRALLVNEVDPDVITGYNINGFDFWYMNQRAIELGVWDEFSCLGRLRGRPCKYTEQRLSSSALGDNILKYVDMHGRVVLDVMKVVQRDHKLDSYKLDLVASHFLGKNKHDVSPQDIFRLQLGSAADRQIIADYCVQDCALCNQLIMKLEILANNVGMSNVCLVPLHYIFVRGQGIKIFSLVMKECKDDGFLIPVVRPMNRGFGQTGDFAEEEDGYEGAIVLEPQTGIYIDEPVSVLDYASLYPSSMISENLSHDSLVLNPKYDNLPGVEYLDVSYDVYDDTKQKAGERVCRYVQPAKGEKGLIPRILQKLLKARKTTRKRMELVALKRDPAVRGWYSAESRELRLEDGSSTLTKVKPEDVEDAFQPFQKAVLDGLQNAYKVTANSLYGQCGARTSPIYMKDIAACTTATGRRMILKAKEFLESKYGAKVVYGDTDSIFTVFPHENNKTGKDLIAPSIALAQKASAEFRKSIKAPHDLEYEKTFWPFILLSKKRYVGNKYEQDDVKFKQNSMGIVLKRRDNAPVVKTIYGGLIDIILNQRDIGASVDFLKTQLERLETHRVDLQELVITKSLRADYKDPLKIAHKVLAERMGERDPGNKPQVNDRIPFVYVQQGPTTSKKKVLQGDRIEHIDYVRQKGLKPDVGFYITNQVMNPVCQLLGIVVEQIPGYKHSTRHFEVLRLRLLKEGVSEDKTRDRIAAAREAEVERLLFEPVVKRIENKKNGNKEITHYFKPKDRR